MRPPVFETLRLVKGEDLNHHGTLFAGRGCAWVIEAGFIAASGVTDPARVVCRKVHAMEFVKPVASGVVLRLRAQLIFAGRSRMVVRVTASPHAESGEPAAIGSLMTFVHVDASGAPLPHGLTVSPETDEERRLWALGRDLA